MLFLALAFTAASPLLFKHSLMLACLFCVKTVIHVCFAFAVTVGSYGLALLAMVETYSHGQPLAEALYGFGFALATLLAVCGGTMVAPRWLARIFLPVAGGFAAMFPIWLYLQSGLAGNWRAAFLWYLAGSVAGSIGAVRLISRSGGPDRVTFGSRIA